MESDRQMLWFNARSVLQGAVVYLALFRVGAMDSVYKLLTKTVRLCTCFRRKRIKGNHAKPSPPFTYDLTPDAPKLQDLQEACLATLSDQIQRLSQEEVDALPVDLAQRLFDRLSRRRLLTYERVSLFKRQFLTHVSLQGTADVEDDWMMMFAASLVLHLDVSYCHNLTNGAFTSIQRFSKLQSLYLDFCTCLTDDGLAGLSHLVHLKALSFKGCGELNGSGLVNLIPLLQLTSLCFEMCPSLVTGLKFIGQLKQLMRLDFSWCSKISAQEIGELRFLNGLTQLELNSARGAIKGLAELTGLHGLQKLGVSGCKLKREEMQALCSFDLLEYLNLERSSFDPAHLDSLQDMAYLNTLRLGFTGVSNRSLQHLGNITSLTFLDLDSCRINDRGTNALTNLTGLQILNLADTVVGDPTAEILPKLTSLEKLNLAYTEVHNDGLAKLSKLVRLRDLNLDSRILTDDVTKHLSNLTSLTKLDMFAARINDASLKNLLYCTALQTLELCGGLLTSQACEIVSHLPKLAYLSVAQNPKIDNHGSMYLRLITSLTSLNISATAIDDGAVPALKNLTCLASLSCYDTEISRCGVQELIRFLPHLKIMKNKTN